MDIKFSFLEDATHGGGKENDIQEFSQFESLEKLEEPVAKNLG